MNLNGIDISKLTDAQVTQLLYQAFVSGNCDPDIFEEVAEDLA
jgi:hypothetical protein